MHHYGVSFSRVKQCQSMATINWLVVPNILQSIFFCYSTKETQVWNNLRVSKLWKNFYLRSTIHLMRKMPYIFYCTFISTTCLSNIIFVSNKHYEASWTCSKRRFSIKWVDSTELEKRKNRFSLIREWIAQTAFVKWFIKKIRLKRTIHPRIEHR